MTKHSAGDVTELAREVLRKGGVVRVPVFGTSMLPLMRSGDVIQVKAADPASVDVGEVVVYARGSRMIAHRLVKRWEVNGVLHFQTKGDAFPRCDPPVLATQLLGTVIQIERNETTMMESMAPSSPATVGSAVWRRELPFNKAGRFAPPKLKRLFVAFRTQVRRQFSR